MRILHVVPSYLPATRYGGPIFSVHGLCKALARLGHEVHVFTTNVDGRSDSGVPLLQPVEMEGVNVWYFPSRRLRRLYWSFEMGRYLKKRIAEFDIVHLHSVYLWPTWAAARAARRCGVPFVLSPRGMLVKELIKRKSRLLKSLWIALIERRTIADAAMVHVTSEEEARCLTAFGFGLKRVAAIPNGVELPPRYPDRKAAADVAAAIDRQPMVLFLGRINWKKGLDRLIGAMRSVPSGHLTIAGNDEEGHLPALKRLVSDYALEDRVSFIPRSVMGPDKEVLFAAAKAFVLSSYSENFGNTVPEAMVRGCPVVVTGEVGAAELVRQAQAGFVVSPDGLADAIHSLLSDQAGAAVMGASGKAWVEQNLQWRDVAIQMDAEYRRILEHD
ncbi:MAG: glycosyltransferase [Gammaproteobacteria bacterium]